MNALKRIFAHFGKFANCHNPYRKKKNLIENERSGRSINSTDTCTNLSFLEVEFCYFWFSFFFSCLYIVDSSFSMRFFLNYTPHFFSYHFSYGTHTYRLSISFLNTNYSSAHVQSVPLHCVELSQSTQ